ncbi:MAG TPA: hypothetical protein VFS42_09305 [Burkholderiaceae bacterium]|nr:hypothetical protein [Burkholderiaceae bacterium]
MALIISGRFGSFGDAERASRGLFNRGVQRDAVQIIYVNPPGEHAITPIGGDEDADPGARRAGKTAWGGVALGAGLGAVLGVVLVALTDLGPAALVVTTLIGAFGGSLGGAFSGMRDSHTLGREADGQQAASRPSGVLVAVRVGENAREQDVVELLERGGALDVERAQGEWQSGQWVDFNPVRRGEPVRREAEHAGM